MRVNLARILVVALLCLATGACAAAEPASPTATETPSPTAPAPQVAATASKPEPLPTQTGVTSGAFCSDDGRPGVTKRGVKMVCKTTPSDSRLRWRKAT